MNEELEVVKNDEKPPMSDRKIQANRQNARKSTGPKTERGKRYSRYNAVTHGMLAGAAIIQTGLGQEDQNKINRLVRGLREEFQPIGRLEELTVEGIAVSYWRLARVLRYENGEIRRRYETERGYDAREEEGHPLSSRLGELVSRLQQAAKELARNGSLSATTRDELVSRAAEANCEELGADLKRAFWDATDEVSTEAAQVRKKELLRVIKEYVRELSYWRDRTREQEDHEVDISDAVSSFPDDEALDKILRYSASIERRLDRQIETLLLLQSRRRGSHVSE